MTRPTGALRRFSGTARYAGSVKLPPREADFADPQAIAVGPDRRLCDRRQRGRRKSAAEAVAHEIATAEIAPREQAVEFFLRHGGSVGEFKARHCRQARRHAASSDGAAA
jgi:hypothetical protein